MRRLLVVAVALAFSAGASAQLYKWKDKNGHVRYGDTPPPGAEVTRIRGASGGPPPAPPAAAKDEKADKGDKALTPEQAFRKRQQERATAEEKAAKERADADAKRANCQSAQTQLRMLQSGQRVSTVNSAGEKVYLDDDQRAAETARAQKSVSDWCS